VLARLNAIDGVQSSSASVGNPEGGLVRVSLRPGANPAKTATEVQRVLSEVVRDRSPVALTQPAATAAVQQKEWLDPKQLANLAATELRTSDDPAPVWIAALLLGALLVVLGFFGWRHLRRRQTGSSGHRPRLSTAP
jgi:hypothetical protein